MIEIKLIKANNYFNGVMIRNHSNMDEIGRDIVCAAVSTLSITLTNYLSEVLNINLKDLNLYMIENEDSPLISIDIRDEGIYKDQKVQSGFLFFEIGIKALIDEYSDYVKLIYREV